MSEKRGLPRDYEYASSNDVLSRKPTRSFSLKSQKPPDMKLRSLLTKAVAHLDRANEDNIKVKYIKEMWEVIETAWQLPVIGRDLAYEFSDTLRREKILAYVISKLQLEGGSPTIQRECAHLLSQILTTDNRHFVAKHSLEIVTKYTKLRDDIELIRINIGILESLFKDSESTCTRLIDFGALDTVLHACRHDDLWTARHCAAALANAAIFGGSINHKRMVSKGAPDWLFPLAFRTDDFCRYYSCLAVTVLAANPLVEKAVVKSSTLDLVEPFVQSHDPYEFSQSSPSHSQGRSASFLQRMIPLLISGCSETQALASFYFAMEASIKAKQQKTQVFSEISAIIPLKRVIATSRSNIARVLASRCLKIIGEDVPRKLSPQIHLWDIEDVQSWLTVAGFRGFQASFRASTVDGEMLLLLTENELKEDLDMRNNVHRKRFIRDLNRLRSGADYRSVDTSGICEWLRAIDTDFAQYTYRLLQAGVDRVFLPMLTDTHLKDDCAIENGVHRTRILASVERLGTEISETGSRRDLSGKHDVFISYRRNNGSHLASLLKVHLQVRGFRVFLDVESLQEGDFADRTLKSVRSASAGFILVLTAGALDKCAIDHEGTDWLHKEIVTAIGSRSNIVPVTTETFQWPLPEDLPKDISQICFYNGVKWIHEYQDACVDKIERFLRGQDPPAAKLSRIASSVKGSRDALSAPPPLRSSTHPNQTVRPSGSSDNLVEAGRFPRPRQRAPPPGQAYNQTGMVPARGVPGAQSESARSLDQGDGAAATYDQSLNPVQYKQSVNSIGSSIPDRSSGSKPKAGSPTSSGSSSSRNLSSSKSIKKDIVRLEEVIADNSRRSKESESESSSSEYDSSGEEWDHKKNTRRGADGKSKSENQTQAVVHIGSASNAKLLNHPPQRKANVDKTEKSGAKKVPEVNKRQVSPEQKIRGSTKYKAPPPPTTSPRQSLTATPTTGGVPEPMPRPMPSTRPLVAHHDISSKPAQLGSRSELGGARNVPPDQLDMQASNQSAPELLRPVARMMEQLPPAKAEHEGITTSSNIPSKSESPNQLQKPPRREVNMSHLSEPGTHENGQSAPITITEIPFTGSLLTDGQLSESEYSDINSLEGEGQEDLRTNADGNEGATTSSASRTTSSSSHSDLDAKSPPRSALEHNSNSNNNNSHHMNGTKTREEPQYRPAVPSRDEPRPNSRSPDAEPRPGSRSQISPSQSIPLNRSSHSVGPGDESNQPTLPSPRKPTSSGLSNLVARRDVAPQEGVYAPRRSASERLQITRPPHPAYPMGSSHFHPAGSNPPPYHQPSPQKSAGYNMEHYKAAMASSMNPSYPAHQHYPPGPTSHAVAKSRPAPPSHGFDTAV